MRILSALRFYLAVVGLSIGLHGGGAEGQTGMALEVVSPEGKTVALNLSELDALDQSEFATSTIWTDGLIRFSGVAVGKILDHVGMTGTTLRLTALNDYSIEMPVAELGVRTPIVATRMDGETMSVRDKGPYWVVYPFDENPGYRTETNHARSVWQLVRLTLLE